MCYVRNVTKQRDKFDPRADQCVFVGYPLGQKGWKVYNLRTKDFQVSRDIVFYEDVFPFGTNLENQTKEINGNLDLQHSISHFPDETESLNGENQRITREDPIDEVDTDHNINTEHNAQSEGRQRPCHSKINFLRLELDSHLLILGTITAIVL